MRSLPGGDADSLRPMVLAFDPQHRLHLAQDDEASRMMDIVDLRYLVAVADAGNFAKAGSSLGRSTSTISRRIARLEEELGLTIFERGNFGIRLTKGGKSVMA